MPKAEVLFESALRALGEPGGLARIAEALGLDPVCRDLADGSALGAEDDDGIRRVVVLAERPGAQVLYIELAELPLPRRVSHIAQRITSGDGVRGHLVVVTDARIRRIVFACHGPEGELRHLTIDAGAIGQADLEALAEMTAQPGEGGVALCLRWSRALDRSRVTARFFADLRAQRARIASGWSGLPRAARSDREQLGLLLLCRLMFLYFLQKDGHLAGDPSYMTHLLQRFSRGRKGGTLFRQVLDPLFFGALNTRPEKRTRAALELGQLPYLNGGLFERTATERRFPGLDLRDTVLTGVFEHLLEHYRFTTRERADDVVEGVSALGVDPEMLGRVFEGLMAPDRRGDTGTFFTPPAVVNPLVTAALAAHLSRRTGVSVPVLESLLNGAREVPLTGGEHAAVARAVNGLRILDPACGSGAFLLGALSRMVRLRAALEPSPAGEIRRDLVARSLYGVDLQADAALLCALRLWLALTVAGEDERERSVRPLPNLDRRIRQGDALLDPFDLTAGASFGSPERRAAADAAVRRSAAALAPLALRYVSAEPGERERIQARLRQCERQLAEVWMQAVGLRLARTIEELENLALERDLFGEPSQDARVALTMLPRAKKDLEAVARLGRAIRDSSALPFFSFAVHFAESTLQGFDLVITNPPWVRAHRWPATLRRMVRERYVVCREPGWKGGATFGHSPAAAGAQTDLALLFLEKSLRLLAEGGTLAMLLPAKTIRSLYGGPARRMLLQETRLDRIEDHSLHQHSLFAADSFALSLIATRPWQSGEEGGNSVEVSMHRRHGDPLRFRIAQRDMPLVPGDEASPWLLAPPAARRAMRRMQSRGPELGRALRIRRGVFTGANDVLILREVEPAIGDLARVRAEGGFQPSSGARNATTAALSRDYEAVLEASAIRPLLRGTDVSAFGFRISRHVIWTHGNGGNAVDPPPRTRRYLERHRARLEARSGLRSGSRIGQLFRVQRDALGPKVVWHDLAQTLHAVAIPATFRCALGRLPVIPLNTVYFIAAASDTDALLLSALLNALPIRVFARAIAERAKDARFRFFAWTIGALPLPPDWRTGQHAIRLAELSRKAHACGELDEKGARELNDCVARMYALSATDAESLEEFDGWLSSR